MEPQLKLALSTILRERVCGGREQWSKDPRSKRTDGQTLIIRPLRLKLAMTRRGTRASSHLLQTPPHSSLIATTKLEVEEEESSKTMSSGTLPLTTYHRAQSLGAGTYGSVVTVYDDEGNQFALKLFLEDDDDEDEEIGMSLGALREISALRVFRHEQEHPNLIAIHDVQTEYEDDEDDVGAGTGGCLSMAMPMFPQGPLSDNLTCLSTKKQKLYVAHGLLSAMAHLHEQGMIHRDLKADNVLLLEADNDDLFQPVLIDFSLAKIMDPMAWYQISSHGDGEDEPTHTGSVGTPTYRAPEVVNQQAYGLISDMWSVGVILLEVLRGKLLEANKDNLARQLIDEELEKLPQDQPFPNLIRGLLQVDPAKRWTAKQALESPVFTKKFPFPVHERTFTKIDLKAALPFDEAEDEEDNQENNVNNVKGNKNKQSKKKTNKVDPKLAKRFQTIQNICTSMEWTHPLTAQAALCYSIQMSQLEDEIDNLKESQALLDCCVLAHKFFEPHLTDLNELEEQDTGSFKNWDIETYVDNEGTIFMMMDFCLYPREIMNMS